MKHVKLFDGFINEKIAYPEGVKSTGDKILDKFAKLINSPSGTVNIMSWAVQGRSVPFMTGPESFSVTGNSSEDFYVINTSKGKFKLTKKDIKKGEELYDEVESIVQTGKPKRSVMESLNEGLTEKAQQFIKICQLVVEKNKKNPEAVQQLIIDHGWSNAKLKDMISKLENL